MQQPFGKCSIGDCKDTGSYVGTCKMQVSQKRCPIDQIIDVPRYECNTHFGSYQKCASAQNFPILGKCNITGCTRRGTHYETNSLTKKHIYKCPMHIYTKPE